MVAAIRYRRMRLVRYAGDFLLTFECSAYAQRMLVDLPERLAGFDLQLHEDKTRFARVWKACLSAQAAM